MLESVELRCWFNCTTADLAWTGDLLEGDGVKHEKAF